MQKGPFAGLLIGRRPKCMSNTPTAYMPAISEKNYEAFRVILLDAPTTFKDRQQCQGLKALDLSSKGWRVQGVEIDPDEFKIECVSKQSPRDLRSLELIALRIGEGRL
jgi:hypothetical protein